MKSCICFPQKYLKTWIKYLPLSSGEILFQQIAPKAGAYSKICSNGYTLIYFSESQLF